MHHPTERIAHITAFVTPVVVHRLERDAKTDGQHLLVGVEHPNHQSARLWVERRPVAVHQGTLQFDWSYLP